MQMRTRCVHLILGKSPHLHYLCTKNTLTSQTKMESKVKNLLRWVTILPYSVLTAWMFYLFNKAFSQIDFFHRERIPLRFAWYYIAACSIVGFLFVHVGTCIAPNKKKTVARILTFLFMIAASIYFLWILKCRDSGWIKECLAAISAAVGSIFACVNLNRTGEDHSDMYERFKNSTKPLSDEQWTELSSAIDEDYPSYHAKLNEMQPMSDLEKQICLLVKTGVPPSRMADILIKSKQSITSIRARLYQKNFRDGGAEDWDRFILSL